MKINNLLDRRFIAYVCAITMVTYIVGILTLMVIFNCNFNDVIIFNYEALNGLGLMPLIMSLLVFFSGFFLLFLIPGWIFSLHFKRAKNDVAIFIGLSFILSITSLIIATTLFKIMTGYSLNRMSFLGIIIIIILGGLVSLWGKRGKDSNRTSHFQFHATRLIPYIALILTGVCFITIFNNTIIARELPKYDYHEEMILSIPLGEQPDSLESFGLANSLKSHLLPYWDLEFADRFGFVFVDPPLYAFIAMFSSLIFGEGKSSLILTSMLFVIILFLIIFAQGKKKEFIRFLVCSLILLSYFYFFLGDINSFISRDHFFIFLIIVSCCYLLRRDYDMFLVFATTATLTRFYGIPFVLLSFLSLAMYFKNRRYELKSTLLKYICVVSGLIIFIVIVGVSTGNLGVYWKMALAEYLVRLDYFNNIYKWFPEAALGMPGFNLSRSLDFLSRCFYSTAYTFPLLFLFGKNKNENFYSFIGLIYFIIVLFSRVQFERYVMLLIPITAIVVCSKLERISS